MTPGQRLYNILSNARVEHVKPDDPVVAWSLSLKEKDRATYEDAAKALIQVPTAWPSGDWSDKRNPVGVAYVDVAIEEDAGWRAIAQTTGGLSRTDAEQWAARFAWMFAGVAPVPALEPPPDREGLARALEHETIGSSAGFDGLNNDERAWWLSVADAAIRLCGGVREEVPEGWPKGWEADLQGIQRAFRFQNDGMGFYRCHYLPNTEPGRLAAWKLEGKDADPYATITAAESALFAAGAPLGSKLLDGIAAIAACLRVADARCLKQEIENTRLRERLESAENGREDFRKAYNEEVLRGNLERLATRTAIESRDLADKEVETLRELLKKANEENANLQHQNRVLLDRNKFVEANLTAVHHDRDTQRAIVDHMRDMIVDIARGRI